MPLVCEYEDVLKRNRSEYSLPFTIEEIDEILDNICAFGISHKIWYLWRPLLTDAKDDFIAELALTAQVKYVVTYNIRHFQPLSHFNIDVITPQEILRKMAEQR